MSEPYLKTHGDGRFTIEGIVMPDGSAPPRALAGPFQFPYQAEQALAKLGVKQPKNPWEETKKRLRDLGIMLNGRPIESIDQENE